MAKQYSNWSSFKKKTYFRSDGKKDEQRLMKFGMSNMIVIHIIDLDSIELKAFCGDLVDEST
jgi:hypothetical protein